jgi:hypothetical protein
MNQFYNLVYGDYLQRTRSYAFLITLAVSLYAAYLFVPAQEANYTTLKIGHYVGVNNSAWSGYVTAMMTSVFLSWIGFYLVNSNIKKDIDTGLGMIIAATPITNFQYLLAKALSNFMVLMTITSIIALMSASVFLIRPGTYAFELQHFIVPFLVITLPTLFVVASLAVFAEVLLYRYTILMNTCYFFLFTALLPAQQYIIPALDVMGIRAVTVGMQNLVGQQFQEYDTVIGMGFHVGKKGNLTYFEFKGLAWTAFLLLTRLLWVSAGFALVYVSGLLFHRFDISSRRKKEKKNGVLDVDEPLDLSLTPSLKDIKLSELPKIKPSFGIGLLIQTELRLLFRRGPKWLWLVNIAGMITLIFTPIHIAHLLVLPILWFLQIMRWSDLATKEKTYRIHYFSFASYKPVSRLFLAQILAGIILAIGLSLPLIIRYVILMQLLPLASIFIGAIFIVVCAVLLGLLSGGKKLFEILFFSLTYCNVNKVPAMDYFGAINTGINYVGLMTALVIVISGLSLIWRRMEISRV